ncbi:MAG TPA: DoxX family protein [Nonomuraea sp.]|nr:DoxX family protein [Nonomuraea sp.]
MKKAVFDVAALIARVATGVIFVAHGWQKWQSGFGGTAQGFREMGIPMPELAAGYATVVETVGGILLIIGLLVRPVALLLLINMLGAIVFAHWNKGVMVSEGGWELAGALAALSLLFLALGGGRLGLDGLIGSVFRRRGGRHRAGDEDVINDRPRTGTSRTTSARTGGPLTPAEPAEPPERPNVPRQPTAQRTGANNLNDEDMRDIDALVSDDQPQHRKPPNR